MKRRVPQILGLYLAAGWGVLEFIDWLVEQYSLSPDLAELALLAWAIMIPTVLILAYFHGASGDQEWTRIEKVAIPANLLVALIVIGVLAPSAITGGGPAESGGAAYEPTRLAVLYFEDDSELQELGHLASTFTGALIDELSQVSVLDVVPRASVKPYRGARVTLDSLARALQIGTLVDGTVSGSKEHLDISVTLIDPATQSTLTNFTLSGPVEEWQYLRDDLAKEVAIRLRERLGPEVRLRERQARTESAQALTLLQQAERLKNEAEDLEQSGDTVGAMTAYAKADTLLAEAESLDPRWIEPVVARGEFALRVSRMLVDLPGSFSVSELLTALYHAERAVDLEPDDPSALELRGRIRLSMSEQYTLADPTELRELAERDLRGAVAADPFRARAWSDLAELHRLGGRFEEAKREAERALEADPFLGNASTVLFKLYEVSLELKEIDEADHWCDEGHRRFAEVSDFYACSLFLMALSAGPPPDVERAWALLDTFAVKTPAPIREQYAAIGEAWVAAVLARAGEADSARSVAQRVLARSTGDLKPWIEYTVANVMLLLGDRDEALSLLGSFLEAVPVRKAYVASDWMFEDLWDDPRFKALVAVEE
ncbi:MAG: hypothetical protein JSU87_17280 [Gemmatimonadota bacterium]|nr:MAG: hypothetical protein JSU87_17280 [Gemmatimonadota bacterium]